MPFIELSWQTSKIILVRSEFWPIGRTWRNKLMENSSNVILEVLIWRTRVIPSMIIAPLSGTSSTGGISASSLCRSTDFGVFFKVPSIPANTNGTAPRENANRSRTLMFRLWALRETFTALNEHNFILDFAVILFLDGVKRRSVASLDGVQEWHPFPRSKSLTDKFCYFIHSVDLSFQHAFSSILSSNYTGWNWSKWHFAEWVNENICKDIHESLNIFFIYPDPGRVQITVVVSLLILGQVLM